MGDMLKNVGSFAAAFAISYAVTTLVENAKNNAYDVDMNDNTRFSGSNNFSNSTAIRNPRDTSRKYS